MRIHLIYVAMMIVFLLALFANQSSYAKEVAICRTQTTNVIFACVIDSRDKCRIIPLVQAPQIKCEPVKCIDKEPDKAATPTFLDMLLKNRKSY